jgi:hypothetical protein
MQRGDEHIGFGIMGGLNQPLAHAQFVSNVVDYHMNIQVAMEEPRVTPATLDALTKDGTCAAGAWQIHIGDGARAGNPSRQQNRGQLWRIRSAGGRRRDSGAAGLLRKIGQALTGIADFATFRLVRDS